jgi:hydroxyethylthiazole kinase
MGALAGACIAAADTPFAGAFATALILGVAGDLAAEKAIRPGSFQIALLDALDELDGNTLRRRARLT